MLEFSILEEIGLSKPEIRVYTSLLEIGGSQTGKLSTQSKVPSSKIYAVLESLIDKGLVSYTLKNNTKVYSAASVDAMRNIFEQKKNELDEKESKLNQLIISLKKTAKHESISHYKYFEGILGIKSMYQEILEHMQDNQTLTLKIHSADVVMTNRLLGFYTEFHKQRIQLGVNYKLILGKDVQVNIAKRVRELTQIKQKTITNKVGWGVFGKYFFLNYNGGKEPYGILVTDPLVAHTFELLFDELWDKVK
jgi:HTH-type transcriptional regulator, sugar sensing transcriptional regulator